MSDEKDKKVKLTKEAMEKIRSLSGIGAAAIMSLSVPSENVAAMEKTGLTNDPNITNKNITIDNSKEKTPSKTTFHFNDSKTLKDLKEINLSTDHLPKIENIQPEINQVENIKAETDTLKSEENKIELETKNQEPNSINQPYQKYIELEEIKDISYKSYLETYTEYLKDKEDLNNYKLELEKDGKDPKTDYSYLEENENLKDTRSELMVAAVSRNIPEFINHAENTTKKAFELSELMEKFVDASLKENATVVVANKETEALKKQLLEKTEQLNSTNEKFAINSWKDMNYKIAPAVRAERDNPGSPEMDKFLDDTYKYFLEKENEKEKENKNIEKVSEEETQKSNQIYKEIYNQRFQRD